MWHLHRTSPLQIFPVGVCPLQRPPTSGTTHSFARPTWHWEVHTDEGCSGKAWLGTAGAWSMGSSPTAPVQRAQMLPTLAPHTPQMALPLCQPPPGWPETPYQQAVQPPGKATGRGVTFNSSINKAAPAGGQSTKDHGRQRTRGWGDSG